MKIVHTHKQLGHNNYIKITQQTQCFKTEDMILAKDYSIKMSLCNKLSRCKQTKHVLHGFVIQVGMSLFN